MRCQLSERNFSGTECCANISLAFCRYTPFRPMSDDRRITLVRSSLTTASRRARVLAAAALVSLTAACGPADLGLGAAGTPPPAAGDANSLPAVERDEQVPADA